MMRTERIGSRLGLIGLITMSCCSVAHAAELLGCEIDKFIASDADMLDGFGEHISVRGNVAIVGAWNDEDKVEPIGGYSFGSAYILRLIDGVWTEEQKLLPSDSESEKRFGNDVAVDGDSVIVGAVGATGYSGAVYFYTRIDGVWTNEQKMQPESVQQPDEFGFSVAIDGDLAIAGSPGDDEGCGPGCNSGAAYIFRNVGGTWIEEQKLIADDPGYQETFGRAVAIRGDTALVTSRVDGDAGVSTGAVWVYKYQNGSWQEVQKLTASDAEVGDLLGHSVALGDGVLVVGALQDDDACPADPLCNSGSAYVFRFDGSKWNEEAKLIAYDGEAEDEYGNAVAIDGDYIVVGARWGDDACPADPGCESGVAYVYHYLNGTWADEGKLRASDTDATASRRQVRQLSHKLEERTLRVRCLERACKLGLGNLRKQDDEGLYWCRTDQQFERHLAGTKGPGCRYCRTYTQVTNAIAGQGIDDGYSPSVSGSFETLEEG